jgi:nicotinate-nucleotide adenylyltransferase
MVKKAFEGEEKIVVSDAELRREGKSYTVETLPAFTGNGELFMLIGTDMFLSFDRWYRYRDIFAMCTLVLMVRESRESGLRAEIDRKKALYEAQGAKICELAAEPFPISSTELRAMIASGNSTDGYIPASVREFIDEKGLYR